VIAAADLAVVYAIGYGLKENDSGAKITVGVSQGVVTLSMAALHLLEAYGVEAVSLLTVLANQLQQITSRLGNLAGNNAHIVDILNPLLSQSRIFNLQKIAKTAFENAETVISTQVAAVAALPKVPPNCWVARAVYGPENPRWILFRQWLFGNGSVPEVRTLLQRVYMRHGESFARIVDKSPCLRKMLRVLMDLVLYIHQKKAGGVGHAKQG
jgi:hypothetical protein